MGKIIVFADFVNKEQARTFRQRLSQKVEEIEIELGLEDEPLTVLTEDAALNLGNLLIDIKESVQSSLDILNISESEDLPEGLDYD